MAIRPLTSSKASPHGAKRAPCQSASIKFLSWTHARPIGSRPAGAAAAMVCGRWERSDNRFLLVSDTGFAGSALLIHETELDKRPQRREGIAPGDLFAF